MIGFILLRLRRAQARRGRVALAFCGIAIATALVAAVIALQESMVGSVERLVGLAGHADLELASAADTGFDASIVDRVAATPGVDHAVPLVRAPVALDGQRILLIGLDARAEALGGDLGDSVLAHEPIVAADPGAYIRGVVLGPGTAARTGAGTGDHVEVVGGDGQRRTVPVADVLHGGPLSQFDGGDMAVALLQLAQQLSGRGDRLDAIEVVANPGTDIDALQRRLADATEHRLAISAPQQRAAEASAELTPLRRLLLFVATLVLAVGALLVFDVAGVIAREQRRELATLRALGARRRLLLAEMLVEAVILGVAASLVGCAVGLVIARLVIGHIPALFVAALGARFSFQLTAVAIPYALGAGVAATFVAILPVARRAATVDPVEAMRNMDPFEGEADETTSRLRIATWSGWLAVLAGLLIVFVVGTDRVVPGLVTVLIVGGFIMVCWGLRRRLCAAAAAIAARFGAAGRLAATALQRAPRRTWLMVSAPAVAVTTAVAIAGVAANAASSADSMFAPYRDIDLVVQTAPGDGLPTDVLMPTSLRQSLAGIPGVASVIADRFTVITIHPTDSAPDHRESAGTPGAGTSRVFLEALGPGSDSPMRRLSSTDAHRALDTATGIVVTRQMARRQNLQVGDTFTLPTPSGPHNARVADIVDFVSVTDSGAMAMSLEQFDRWFGDGGAGRFEMYLRPGADSVAVRGAAGRVGSGTGLPITVLTGAELGQALEGVITQLTSVFAAMQWIAAVAAALAVLSALWLSIAERRRELGVLRAIGAARRQVARSVMLEAATAALVGAVIGVAAGEVLHRAGVATLDDLIGFPVAYRFVAITPLLALVATIVLVVLGARIPALRAARAEIAEAIAYE